MTTKFKCPHCGSIEYDIIGSYLRDNDSDTVPQYIIECKCEKCKQGFNEVYNLKFVTIE